LLVAATVKGMYQTTEGATPAPILPTGERDAKSPLVLLNPELKAPQLPANIKFIDATTISDGLPVNIRVSVSLKAGDFTALRAPVGNWPEFVAMAEASGHPVLSIQQTPGNTQEVPVDGIEFLSVQDLADRSRASWDYRGLDSSVNGIDFIGDVHGQFDALQELLAKLGYSENFEHPDRRVAVFVGDLVDKGPRSLDVLALVADAVSAGRALCVRGNHEEKFARTIARIQADPQSMNEAKANARGALRELLDGPSPERRGEELKQAIFGMPFHLVLDGGDVAVVHAATKSDLIGEDGPNAKARGYMLHGPKGANKVLASDGNWYNERLPWWNTYDGEPTIVHGHVVVDDVIVRESDKDSVGDIISIDTGAGDGGSLSSLSWPQRKVTSVKIP
jgi:hypothetical protein